MGKKNIDLDILQKEANELKCAVEEFEPCYKEFIASAMEGMDCNNSDFMEAFEKLLRTFRDNKVKKAWEGVSCYYEDVKGVYEVWRGLDEDLSAKIKEDGQS